MSDRTRDVTLALLTQASALVCGTVAMSLTVGHAMSAHGAHGSTRWLGVLAVLFWVGVPTLLALAGTFAARFADHRRLWAAVVIVPAALLVLTIAAIG